MPGRRSSLPSRSASSKTGPSAPGGRRNRLRSWVPKWRWSTRSRKRSAGRWGSDMETLFTQALVAGVERVTAWADLLDDINVFPVADGDTGRNLVVSLSPLRRISLGREKIIRELLFSARGNSGNIA